MKTMYERIRDLRVALNMSQDDLAKAMGYSDRSMITKIEGGKVDLSQSKVIAFAKVLGSTPRYLMDGDPADEIHTPEAMVLAKGIDTMPAAQREAILNMMMGLYPNVFKKGTDDDDA